MANITAAIANRGYYITPHFVKSNDLINNKVNKNLLYYFQKFQHVVFKLKNLITFCGKGFFVK